MAAASDLLPLWLTPFNKANEMRSTLEIMLAVVIFVLVIACANVGNLLLVRFFARRREMIVRLALGAARGRLVRQLLTEGLILSAFGAVGGLLVARWCRHVLVLFFPRTGTVPYLPGEIDWRVLTLSIARVCALDAAVRLGSGNAGQQNRPRHRAEIRNGRPRQWSGQIPACAPDLF